MPKRKSAKHGKKKRSQKGRGILSDVNKFVKEHKLISRGLGMIPHPAAQGLSWGASQLGYGRQHGSGFFSDLGGGIGSVFGGLGGGIGSIVHGLFGSGAQRPVLMPL